MSVAGPLEPAASAAPVRPARRHPRLDQMKRTWYFFRRNTLAVVGLVVLLAIGGIAGFGAAQKNIDWYSMPSYCVSDYGPGNPSSGWYHWNNTISIWQGDGKFNDSVISCTNPICTYEINPPPNASAYCGGHWYKTPYYCDFYPYYCHYYDPTAPPLSFPALLGPTVNLGTLQGGPMPMGALSLSVTSAAPLYNIWTGLLRGSDWSLIFAVSIVSMGALMGLLVGAVAGFFGGIIDDVLMRIVDVFLSIPVILFVIVVIVALTTANANGLPYIGPENTPLFLLVISFAIVWWPLYSRIVRGQVLIIREQKYVEAAKASGAGAGRILRRHIIPNSIQPIFIQFSLDVGTIPLLIGGLQFLGFGHLLFPPSSQGVFPEWGAISALGVTGLPSALTTCTSASGCFIPWWQLFFPGMALFMFAISVNLLADGLRDALDPRLLR